jgi:hypothetical protein
MLMSRYLAIILFASVSFLAYAKETVLHGSVEVKIKPTHPSFTNEELVFKLPQYRLSPYGLEQLRNKLQDYKRLRPIISNQPRDLPRKVDLGMQGTPVLNQGRHGSCVTFAVTGALDALLGAGDYISQLCNLELGSQLAIEGKQPYSGWDGNYASLVLEQIDNYGIISQMQQKMHGCAGLNEYPLNAPNDIGNPMPVAEFTVLSIPIKKLYSWEVLLFHEGWLLPNHTMDEVIARVKQELVKGNRLTFGVLLDTKLGYAGAMGTYHYPNDTWMLTPQIIQDGMNGKITAGHDMVIIGYNDDALVYDNNGQVSQGILILRNSWSSLVGDHGNYYVSYDYFKYFTQELHLYYLNKNNNFKT